MRLLAGLISSLLLGPALAGAADECIRFGGLVPTFAREFSLDVKKARIQFQALPVTPDPERAAYLMKNQESCSISGDCDALVFLREKSGCYREALRFRGRYRGLERKAGREIASLKIESRMEGEGSGPVLIQRRTRIFDYSPSANRFTESK